MKKIISFVLGAAVAFSAAAQNWEDALFFSENNYIGTARSLAMGNALTAIGGDPGSFTLNPAGSSVASYSQVFITPGISISSMTAQGTILPGDDAAVGLGDKVGTGYVRMKLPNAGFVFNFDTGLRNGWKRLSLGFLVNATNDYTGRFNASGVNASNSFAGSVATSSDGYNRSDMGSSDWYYSGDPARMPSWMDMTAYRAGITNTLSGSNDTYIGITEVTDGTDIWLADPLKQQYGQQAYGGKWDALLNFSANYADILYLGANVGITNLSYVLNEYWSEAPNNPEEFPLIEYEDGSQAQFNSLTMKRNYNVRGAGVYFKAGFLWRPVGGLRLGAAVQTPMWLDLTERYSYSASVSTTGRVMPTAGSPQDEWGYSLRNPFRVNAGVAYSFGSVAVLSMDYEFANMASAYFRNRGNYANFNFADTNTDIRNNLGGQHQFRVGLEVKPVPSFAIRGGFNYIGSGLSGKEGLSVGTTSGSFGLGWSSRGAFYADLAVRARFAPDRYIIPYYYYKPVSSSQPYYKYIDDSVLTPEVCVKTAVVDVALTLGMRF